jgi:hypothetical protein
VPAKQLCGYQARSISQAAVPDYTCDPPVIIKINILIRDE